MGVHDWSDAFASLVGRCSGKMQVRHDPVNLPLVWLLFNDGRMIPPQYRYLGHPRITPIGVAIQVSLTQFVSGIYTNFGPQRRNLDELAVYTRSEAGCRPFLRIP